MMRWIALALGVTAMVSGCKSAPRRLVSEAGCSAALAYLKDFKARAGRPIGFSLQTPDVGTIAGVEAVLKANPKFENSEEAAQARAMAAARDVRVADHCPEIRAWLKAVGAVQDSAELHRLTGWKPWPIAVISLSAPVLSRSRNTVSFLVSEYWAPLGGGTMEITYRRGADGRWRMASSHQISVS